VTGITVLTPEEEKDISLLQNIQTSPGV